MYSITLVSTDGEMIVVISVFDHSPETLLVSVAYGEQHIPPFPVPLAALELLTGGKNGQAKDAK